MLKDRKENFRSNIKCGLFNPSESETRPVSEIFLHSIIKKLKRFMKLNQYREIWTVISWLKIIGNIKTLRFLIFDIVGIFPSMAGKLFHSSIMFVKNPTAISDQEINTFKLSTKAFLFDSNDSSLKLKKLCITIKAILIESVLF